MHILYVQEIPITLAYNFVWHIVSIMHVLDVTNSSHINIL